MKQKLLVQVLLFSCLWIFDIILTTWGMMVYPARFSEANPYLQHVMKALGVMPTLYSIKGGLLLILFVTTWLIVTREPKAMRYLIRPLIVLNLIMVFTLGSWGYGFAFR